MHTMVHENIKKFMEGFTYDAHPDGRVRQHRRRDVDVLSRTASRSSTPNRASKQIHRLIAKTPTIAAYAYRHSIGRPYVYPDNDLSFTGNFLNMLFKMTEVKYQPNQKLERALDVLFILHADHEQNCSTSTMRAHRQLARRSVLGAGRRGRGALRPAARRRQRSRAAHAEGNRLGRPHPRLHQEGQGRRRPPDGLRPPRLQVVRPARQDHQEDRLRSVRGHGQEPAARHRARARTHRARGRILRQRASSTRTSTSTRA